MILCFFVSILKQSWNPRKRTIKMLLSATGSDRALYFHYLKHQRQVYRVLVSFSNIGMSHTSAEANAYIKRAVVKWGLEELCLPWLLLNDYRQWNGEPKARHRPAQSSFSPPCRIKKIKRNDLPSRGGFYQEKARMSKHQTKGLKVVFVPVLKWLWLGWDVGQGYQRTPSKQTIKVLAT